jgi:glycosyltransferase involved in cell wall biosynthesis
MKKSTICLNFICRDNIKTIEHMIMSAEPIIDEVVACDTGSVDGTLELLTKLKQKFETEFKKDFHIVEDKWKNFGHNRTLMSKHAYKKAKSDYIMIVDTDAWVEFTENFPKKFTHDFYNLNWYFASTLINLPLFLKNKKAWKWNNYAHNVLDTNGESKGGTIKGILVKEDGRNRTEENKHLNRTYNLLKQQIEDGNNTSRTDFYFARVSSGINPTESIEYYYKVINGDNWSEEKYISCCDLANLEPDKKIEHLLNAYQINPLRAEALYYLGHHYRVAQKYHLAEFFLMKSISIEYSDKVLFVAINVYTYLRYFEASIALYWTGKFKEAFHYATMIQNMENIPNGIKEQNEKNLEFVNSKM